MSEGKVHASNCDTMSVRRDTAFSGDFSHAFIKNNMLFVKKVALLVWFTARNIMCCNLLFNSMFKQPALDCISFASVLFSNIGG